MAGTLAPPGPLGFTFSETMGGFIAPYPPDYRRAAAAGRAADDRLRFRVRVTIPDLDHFIRDPAHQAELSGTVEAARFGGVCPIDTGTFHLFIEDERGRKEMRYRLYFRDAAGHAHRLEGYKDVHQDHGLDVWVDTTTLFTTVRREDQTDEPVVARGMLHIRARDLVPQVASMRALNADGPRDHVWTLLRFSSFFAGRLWHEYGPMGKGAARRQRRATTSE